MKIIYIPYKKNLLLYAVILCVLIFAGVIIGMGDSLPVFGMTGQSPVYKGNENKSVVAFECNVVWGTEFIPDMLDIFRERDIRITFFIGGQWAKDNPDLLKQMASEGHEIGNHGYSHKHHSNLDLSGNLKEIRDTESVIKSILGVKTTLFAPPYGEFNNTTLQAADSLGYKTIMWSIDTIDWRRDGVENITRRVFKNPHNGAFILMHPTEDTLRALPGMIEGFEDMGFKVGTISDAMD